MSMCLLSAGLCRSQNPSDEVCSDTTISGEVNRGDRFEAALGRGLTFLLDPSIGPPNPDGWTIRILGEHPDNDFLMVATPPYRFFNPRYVDTSYGNTAEQAVAWSERSFSFVRTEEGFQRMHEAIGVLLWSAGHDSSDIEVAEKVATSVEKGSGVFRIVGSETSSPNREAPMGRIERLEFEVDFCFR